MTLGAAPLGTLPLGTLPAATGGVLALTALTVSNITSTGARFTVSISNNAAGTLRLAVYPAGSATPTYTIGVGWSGSPVYTDSDTDPGTGSTYQFTPDISGLSPSTSYDAYAVWEDGSTVVGPVSALGWSTTSAGVSGTLSTTETGIDSATLSGAVLVSGSLSASESGGDTAALSGAVLVAGTLSVGEAGDDTFAASGAGQVAGTLSAAESGADTLASSGAVLVSGNLSVTETGSDTFFAIGGNFVSGTLSAQESGNDTFAASGVVAIAGTIAASETGSDTFVSSGTVKVSGVVAASETGSDIAAFSGQIIVSGGLVSAESGADTFQASSGGYTITFAQAQLLSQIYLLHGLGSPLSVAPTSRAVAGLSQEITSLSGTVTIKTLTQESAVTTPVGTMLEELAALHGITVDLVVTPTSRTAGGISQAFTTVGSQTTVTRQ